MSATLEEIVGSAMYDIINALMTASDVYDFIYQDNRSKAIPRTLRSSVVQRKEENKMDKNVMINELNKLEIIGISFFVGAGLLIFVLISLRIKNLKNTTKDEMEINRLKRTRTMTVMLSLFGQILTIIYCHM